MKGVALGIVWVAPVDGEASAQPVPSLLHIVDRPQHTVTWEALSGDVHHAEQATGIVDLVIAVPVLVG
jgi:hypothetical protein